MDIGHTAFIKSIRSIDVDGDELIDIVELMDGQVLAIDGELVVLYADIGTFRAERMHPPAVAPRSGLAF